jgi:hypothetical protein
VPGKAFNRIAVLAVERLALRVNVPFTQKRYVHHILYPFGRLAPRHLKHRFDHKRYGHLRVVPSPMDDVSQDWYRSGHRLGPLSNSVGWNAWLL